MNKKLIALAIAAAIAAPAAMAQVTIYGKVHMDVIVNDDENGATADPGENVTVNQNASRLGFKGSEDLGNGLKAIFQYEMTYSGLDSGTAIGGARNSFVGLSGGFGTLLVGRHDTPAKSAYYASGNDHLGDSIIDLNRMGFTERRVNNAVAYISPNMSGFKVAAMVMPGEESGTAVADDPNTPNVNESARNDENGFVDSYSLGVMYSGHGLKAGLGYEEIADTRNAANNPNNNDMSTLHAGASYTISGFTFGAQYAKHDNVDNADGVETDVWAIAAKYAFGNNAIIANYGQNETENNGNTTETDYIGVGFQHKMSKRTSVYAAFNRVDNDSADGSNFGVGVVHNF